MIDHTTLKPGRLGNFPAKRPCAECPLRRVSEPGELGGYEPFQYTDILHGPASIACHMSKGFATGDLEAQRHCCGVAHYRANNGVVAWGGAGDAVARAGENRDAVFANPQEFLDHHRGR